MSLTFNKSHAKSQETFTPAVPGVYDLRIDDVRLLERGEKRANGLENKIAEDVVFITLRVVKEHERDMNEEKEQLGNTIEVFFTDPETAPNDNVREKANISIIQFLTSITDGTENLYEGMTKAQAIKALEESRSSKMEQLEKEITDWNSVGTAFENRKGQYVRSLMKALYNKRDEKYYVNFPRYDANKFEPVEFPYKVTTLEFSPAKHSMPVQPDTEKTDTTDSPLDAKPDDLPF